MKTKNINLTIIVYFLAVLLVLYGLAMIFHDRLAFQPKESSLPEGADIHVDEKDTIEIKDTDEVFTVIAENLDIPWEIEFLPDGGMLVTERSGNLVRIYLDENGVEIPEERVVIPIEGVDHDGEGGLLGMTLHPNFSMNNLIYLYLTFDAGNETVNRVVRYRFKDDQLYEEEVILDNIPGAKYHDGGRIEFGPDGYLYITAGDASNSDLSQEVDSLAGKILRITADGGVPDDNPFNNPVYSYGHRNAQGIDWDSRGNLWATEHGRSVTASGLDELNLIKAGKNYGWPLIQGDETDPEMVTPVVNSGPDETWAPAGLEYYNGSLYFAGLRGQGIYEAVIDEDTGKVDEMKIHFVEDFGRLRAVKAGPDGYIYITTSNRDGRGNPKEGDDKIMKINPLVFTSQS